MAHYEEGVMDALSIFPILLAFMIIILTALGYALHQLAKASYSGNPPPILALKCPHCQQEANMNWSHCPACGTVLTYELFPDTTARHPNDASPLGIADPT